MKVHEFLHDLYFDTEVRILDTEDNELDNVRAVDGSKKYDDSEIVLTKAVGYNIIKIYIEAEEN